MRAVLREFDKFRTRRRALPVAVGARRRYHSIRRMQFHISVKLIDLSNVQLAPFLRLLLPKCRFHSSSSLEFEIAG